MSDELIRMVCDYKRIEESLKGYENKVIQNFEDNVVKNFIASKEEDTLIRLAKAYYYGFCTCIRDATDYAIAEYYLGSIHKSKEKLFINILASVQDTTPIMSLRTWKKFMRHINKIVSWDKDMLKIYDILKYFDVLTDDDHMLGFIVAMQITGSDILEEIVKTSQGKKYIEYNGYTIYSYVIQKLIQCDNSLGSDIQIFQGIESLSPTSVYEKLTGEKVRIKDSKEMVQPEPLIAEEDLEALFTYIRNMVLATTGKKLENDDLIDLVKSVIEPENYSNIQI